MKWIGRKIRNPDDQTTDRPRPSARWRPEPSETLAPSPPAQSVETEPAPFEKEEQQQNLTTLKPLLINYTLVLMQQEEREKEERELNRTLLALEEANRSSGSSTSRCEGKIFCLLSFEYAALIFIVIVAAVPLIIYVAYWCYRKRNKRLDRDELDSFRLKRQQSSQSSASQTQTAAVASPLLEKEDEAKQSTPSKPPRRGRSYTTRGPDTTLSPYDPDKTYYFVGPQSPNDNGERTYKI